MMVSRGLLVLVLWLASALPGVAEASTTGIPPVEAVWQAVVLTEAAGEPFECKVGVAEVLRNRSWNLKGFVGIRRADLQKFLARQPRAVHVEARRALEAARAGSNLTRRATHFENVEAFGLPGWAHRMERTVNLGRLTFFKGRARG